jgi:hypothetical protein
MHLQNCEIGWTGAKDPQAASVLAVTRKLKTCALPEGQQQQRFLIIGQKESISGPCGFAFHE